MEEKLIKLFKNYFGEINSNEKYFTFEYVNSLQDSIYNFNKYLRENESIKLVKNK